MIEPGKEITREEIQAELIAIINQTVVNESPFLDDSEYDDVDEDTVINEVYYDLDDFDAVEIIMELEQSFGIEIPDSDVFEVVEGNFGFKFKFGTIGEFTDYLVNKIKSKP